MGEAGGGGGGGGGEWTIPKIKVDEVLIMSLPLSFQARVSVHSLTTRVTLH